MEQRPNDRESKVSTGPYWPIALGVGTAIGVGVGAAMDNIGVGAAIGIALGVVVGLLLSRQRENESGDS